MKLKLILFIFSIIIYSYANSQNTIIFSEDFEISNKQELLKKWEEISNLSGMSLSSEKPPASNGNKSLMIVYNPARNNGGHLFKAFERGYDKLFARFYCKFSNNHSLINQFVKLGGYNPQTNFSQRDFNILPSGDDRFSAGPIVRTSSKFWDLNVNWKNMRVNPDTVVLPNHFNPNPPVYANDNKWFCVEFMIKLNDPINSSNGELALWIEGKKIIHLGQGFPDGYWENENFHPSADNAPFDGFQWRNSDNLKINYFWFLYYITDGISEKRDTLWIDDIILATDYIGPIGGSNISGGSQNSNPKILFNYKSNSISLDGLEKDEIIKELRFYNLLGQIILDLNYSNGISCSKQEISLNSNKLEKGFYLVYLRTSKNEIFSKFLLFPN